MPEQLLDMTREAIPQSDLSHPQSDALFLRMNVCSQPILSAPAMHAAVGLDLRASILKPADGQSSPADNDPAAKREPGA